MSSNEKYHCYYGKDQDHVWAILHILQILKVSDFYELGFFIPGIDSYEKTHLSVEIL